MKHCFFTLALCLILLTSGDARAEILNSLVKPQVGNGRIMFTTTRSGQFNHTNTSTTNGISTIRKLSLQPTSGGKVNFSITETSVRSVTKYLCKESNELDFLVYNKRENTYLRYTQSPVDALLLEMGEPSAEILEEIKAIDVATQLKKGDAKKDEAKKDEPAEKPAAVVKRNVRTYKANSIWELVFIIPDDDLLRFGTMLTAIHRDLRLADLRERFGAALVEAAGRGEATDMASCEALVAQLADTDFAVREVASRQLLRMGGDTLIYLMSLDFDALEPEQQLRLKRIRQQLETGTEEEDIQLYARSLQRRPQVWVGLLESEHLTQRVVAFEQLKTLLGSEIDYNPSLPAKEQPEALARLREKAGGKM